MVTPWEPFGSLLGEANRFRSEMDRLFHRWSPGAGVAVAAYPPLNLWEDEDRLYVETELPGMSIDDLEIFVNGRDQLSIKGVRKPPSVEGGAWHRQERGIGGFSRLFDLPVDVDPNGVEADFKDGVLTITMPKSEESKPRRIEVKSE